jgi:hypothetical protein
MSRLSAAATLFSALGLAFVRAEQVTVFNDVFADGERLTQSLPSSVAWHQNTTTAANLAVRNGALDLVAGNLSRTLWAYFPAINLKLGESLSLTLDLAFTTAPSSEGGFRVGLCHTNGVAAQLVDGGPPPGAYEGYALTDNLAGGAAPTVHLIKRNGPAAGRADAPLINSLGSGDQTIWTPVDAAAGIRGVSLANTSYRVVLKATRIGSDTTSLTGSVFGGPLPVSNTFTVNDSGGSFASFNLVTLALLGNSVAGDVLVTRASLVADLATSSAGRLVNMSIRTRAGVEDATLIVGVGVGGPGAIGTKPVLFRAVGPTLSTFNPEGVLADPVISAFRESTAIAQNDDWSGGFDFGTLGAFPLAGTAPRDAALYEVALPIGGYTLQITGKNNATGLALAEIYDATPASLVTTNTPRLINVSARTQVGTGDSILITGFVVGGTTPLRVLVRAVGPTLANFGVSGVLENPRLDLSSVGARVGENDNWDGTAELKAAFASVGAFPLAADDSRDAALVVRLTPGNYTAQVSGVGGTTGVALVEVYEVP